MTWVTRDIHTHKKKRSYHFEGGHFISSDPQASKLCSEGCFRRHYVNLLVIMNICLCNQFQVCRDQQSRNMTFVNTILNLGLVDHGQCATVIKDYQAYLTYGHRYKRSCNVR